MRHSGNGKPEWLFRGLKERALFWCDHEIVNGESGWTPGEGSQGGRQSASPGPPWTWKAVHFRGICIFLTFSTTPSFKGKMPRAASTNWSLWVLGQQPCPCGGSDSRSQPPLLGSGPWRFSGVFQPGEGLRGPAGSRAVGQAGGSELVLGRATRSCPFSAPRCGTDPAAADPDVGLGLAEGPQCGAWEKGRWGQQGPLLPAPEKAPSHTPEVAPALASQLRVTTLSPPFRPSPQPWTPAPLLPTGLNCPPENGSEIPFIAV